MVKAGDVNNKGSLFTVVSWGLADTVAHRVKLFEDGVGSFETGRKFWASGRVDVVSPMDSAKENLIANVKFDILAMVVRIACLPVVSVSDNIFDHCEGGHDFFGGMLCGGNWRFG